jgi:ABC-type sugar transport system ATPase subunit
VHLRAVRGWEVLIRIEDITVDLGEFILKDVNLEIKRGEYFVVLGPTGAGKSVLLETIAGLYQPQKGMIEINGRDVTRAEPRRRNISIVYQVFCTGNQIRFQVVNCSE